MYRVGENWLNYKGNEVFQSIPPLFGPPGYKQPGGFFYWQKKKDIQKLNAFHRISSAHLYS